MIRAAKVSRLANERWTRIAWNLAVGLMWANGLLILMGTIYQGVAVSSQTAARFFYTHIVFYLLTCFGFLNRDYGTPGTEFTYKLRRGAVTAGDILVLRWLVPKLSFLLMLGLFAALCSQVLNMLT